MKRREFLTSGAKALLISPLIFDKSFSLFTKYSASHLVSVHDRLASTLDMRVGQTTNPDGVIVDKILSYAVNRTRVFSMVDTAVKKLTGKATVGQAWESLFPAGHPTRDTLISVKINLSYGEREYENDWSKTACPFGPKAAVTDAIVWGLTQMLDGTFPIENILLFDSAYSSQMRRLFPIVQGYRPVLADERGMSKDVSPGTYGLHWVAPRHPFGLPSDAPQFIAAPDFAAPYRAPQRILPPVYQSDFMINVAIPKTHREAGVTGVMKNTYGCTDNPVGTHGDTWQNDDTPYPGSRLCAPVFYKSLDEVTPCILNVMDALGGVYCGGPLSGKAFHANTIALSRDPVAIDTWMLHLINKYRSRSGLTTLSTEDGRTKDGFPNASFLRIAEEKHNMGSMSMDGVYDYDLSASPESYDIPILEMSQSRVSDVFKIRNRYRLDVEMDHSRRRHMVESWIEDIDGNTIRKFSAKSTRSPQMSIDWNFSDENKTAVANGLYVWHVAVDGIRHSRVINAI